MSFLLRSTLLFTIALAMQAQTPRVADVSPASGRGIKEVISPGEVIVVRGEALFAQERGELCGDRNQPWPTATSPCRVQVTIGGSPAAVGEGLFFSSLLVQVPWDLEAGLVDLIAAVEGLQPPAEIRIEGKDFVPIGGQTVTDPIFLDVLPFSPVLDSILEADGRERISALNPARADMPIVIEAYGLGMPENQPRIGQPASERTPILAQIEVLLRPTHTAVAQVGPEIRVDIAAAELVPDRVGVYEVLFSIPSNTAAGDYMVSIEASDPAIGLVQRSNERVISVAEVAAEAPALNSLANAASFATGPVSPGTIVSVFVSGIAGERILAAFPSTDANGLSVLFGETPAVLFAVIPDRGQLNLLVPRALPTTGSTDLTLRTAAGDASVQIDLASYSPGIFPVDDPTTPGRRFAAATLANTSWLLLPDVVSNALGLPTGCGDTGVSPASFCGQPARAGDVIQLFVTGLGLATPGGDSSGQQLPDGEPAPADGNPLYTTVDTPEVLIGGIPAQVTFAGLAPGFAGLYQVNVVIPAGVQAGDTVELVVRMPDGSSDSALIAIGPA